MIEIQEAYETLSDVNQRTWYDNNRERILKKGKDNMTKEEKANQAYGLDI